MAEDMQHECECGLYSGQHGYDKDWLCGTFTQAMFVGNGQMAILSGFLVYTLVEGLSLGPMRPSEQINFQT